MFIIVCKGLLLRSPQYGQSFAFLLISFPQVLHSTSFFSSNLLRTTHSNPNANKIIIASVISLPSSLILVYWFLQHNISEVWAT